MISGSKHEHKTSGRGCDTAFLIVAAAGLGVWTWFALATGTRLEDAYITFRYAKNIAEGTGFVFNAGEHVLGTTTPLQTLLLAGLGVIFGPTHIPSIASVLMPVFGIAASALVYLTLVRCGISRTGATAGGLIFFLQPLVIRTSLGGMETPLVLFLMALSLYFLSKGQTIYATAAVAFLALCRVDGLIWGSLILGASLLSRSRHVIKQAVVFSAILLPWIVFSFFYFGSPIPNTMLAKGVVRPGRENLLLNPAHIEKYVNWFSSGSGVGIDQPLFPVWIALVLIGAYAILRTRQTALLPLVLFPPYYSVLMYFGRAPRYMWYLLPIVLCCVFLGGAGIGAVVSGILSRIRDWRLRVAFAACATAALALPLYSMICSLQPTVRHVKRFQENEDGLRRNLGLWLRNNTPENATVAMEAIGYQGYFCDRHIIDMAGLVTPRVVDFKAGSGENGVVFRRITTELKPDYIVLRSFEVDENRHFNGGELFPSPADRELFDNNYVEAKRFVAPHPRLVALVTRLTVYQRR